MKTASQPYQTGPVNSPCPPESQRPVGTFADPDAALTQLLYEKRYSLLWVGGHRWIDLRRYDRLGTLPLDLPVHTVNDRYPIPGDEQLARK
jgi:hypothetical protein